MRSYIIIIILYLCYQQDNTGCDELQYLNGIFHGTAKQKECSCSLKLLLSQQRECILQSCLAPTILREVVLEKLSHFLFID